MKKFNLSWTEGLIDRVAKLEFLLVEVIVLLSVFIIVQQANPDIEAYEVNDYASLQVTWNRPSAHVTFNDSSGGNVQTCTSSSTSCRTGEWKYWPGSNVIYVVRANNSSGAVIKTGGTTADSRGRANANWDWDYQWAAYPNLYTDCVAAGREGKCRTGIVYDRTATPITITAGKLDPGQWYRVVVCAPNCGNGTVVHQYTTATAVPAKLNSANVGRSCNGFGRVNVDLSWTPPAGATFDLQYLDLSIYDDNFTAGVNAKQLSAGQTTYSAGDFLPGIRYYWRINSRIMGTTNSWVTSATGVFDTPNCAPQLACQDVDFTRDGSINSSDYGLVALKRAPAPYDPAFDLNKDGKVDDADILLTAQFSGQKCYPRDYAISLTASGECTVFGPGNNVRVRFSWNPASGGTYTDQFLDYDIFQHGDTGWPANIALQVPVGTGTSTLEGFAQDVTYYWRINTKEQDGTWKGSAVRSFRTPKCYTPVEPKNLQSAISAGSQTLPDGTRCVDRNYAIVFAWQGTGAGWWLDVAVDDPHFKNYHNFNASGKSVLITAGQHFNPPMLFEPGKTYFWRMYSQETGKWYKPTIQYDAIKVPYCNPPALNEFPEGWPTSKGVVSQGPRGGGSHGGLDAIDITGPLETPIYSTVDGVVDLLCVDGHSCAYGGLGNAVVIKNPSHAHLLIFAHLNSFNVVQGQNVKKGDKIGGMGETGFVIDSSGVGNAIHLHYEFRGLAMGSPYIPISVRQGCVNEADCGVSW